MNHTNRSSAKRLRLRHAVPSLCRRRSCSTARGIAGCRRHAKADRLYGRKDTHADRRGREGSVVRPPGPGFHRDQGPCGHGLYLRATEAAADQNRIRGERGNHAGNGGGGSFDRVPGVTIQVTDREACPTEKKNRRAVGGPCPPAGPASLGAEPNSKEVAYTL